MSDFKEKDKTVKEIFKKYNKLQFNRFILHEKDEEDKLLYLVDYALKHMDESYAFLLRKEYIDCAPRYWWNQYYSKTTYYRIKNNALDALLACLK